MLWPPATVLIGCVKPPVGWHGLQRSWPFWWYFTPLGWSAEGSGPAITPDTALIEHFRSARRDPQRVVLEGFHPLKHAQRFGAQVELIVTADPPQVHRLAGQLAPDVATPIMEQAVSVAPGVFAQLAPVPPETGLMAIARRPSQPTAARLLAGPRTAPLVFLEQPSHLGNVGAVIRVAAAAGATGVMTVGTQNPWHPVAVRGAAGLQFALPVVGVEGIAVEDGPSFWSALQGPLLGIHPEGEPLTPGTIPADAVLAFGSERRGLRPALLARVDRCITIPMAAGVSSLNLATAVAVALYAWRLGPASGGAQHSD